MRQLAITIVLLAGLLLAGCPRVNAAVDWPIINLVPVASGLTGVTHIANAGDGSGRLFVVQQTGQIRVVQNGVVTSTFLDISSRVSCCGERGLLSVAFPTSYATKKYFYVYYTDAAGSVTLARYFVNSATPEVPEAAIFNSEQIVLSIPHSTFANHNGGQLAFGPDGYLYMGPGDGGGGGDTLGNGQNTNALLGKILRLDVESGVIPYPTPTPAGHAPYVIPPTNPFVSTAGYRPEIWALGMRNPFRFSFDRQTHDLYIGDVGQNTYEEVDFQPAGSSGGQNYGWNIMEGFHCYSPANCSSAGLTLPILEYSHGAGDCSITGGFVYRGSQSARMNGIYFYSDYCSGRIWGAVSQGGTWLTNVLYDAPFNVTTFGEDEAGNLYLNDYTGGVLYMLAEAVTPTPTATATPGVPAGPCGPVTFGGAVNVAVNGNSLQKSAGGAAWNAGAISSTQLTAGDGAVQVQADGTVSYRMVGLSNGDPDQSYGSIKYGLILGDAGVLYVYESGVSRGQWTYTTGDLLKVELSGGVVRYWRMAAGSAMWTLLYTSTAPPVYPLLVDTTIYTMGAQLQSVQFGTGSCPAPPTPTPTSTRTWTPTLVPSATPTPVPPAGPCGPATWANAVNVTVNGNTLQKSAGGAAWNAGAISSTQLSAGDGAVQVQADGTVSYRMFGLSNGDPDQSYGSIKYGLILGDAGVLYVYESGVSRGQWTYTTGDLLKVELSGGVVRYWRMAAGSAMWTLLYTSTVPPVYPLLVDTTIYTMGALLQSMQFGTGSCPAPPTPTPTSTRTWTPTLVPPATPTPVPPAGPCAPTTWANAVNVAVSGNSLQKTAGGAAWNAGAISSTQLTAGDGAVQVQADGTVGYRMFGLSNGDPDQSYGSIKYGLILGDAGVLYVYESGVSRGQWTYTTGDLLKVELSGGVVRYWRMAAGSAMWTLLYTSTVPPVYPLLVDTTIYTMGALLQSVQFGTGSCPAPPTPTPTSTRTWTPTLVPPATPTPVPPAGPCGPTTWANAVNVAVSGNSLQKTAGGAAWNAGAISSTQLTAGDGAVQVQADGTVSYRMFGLSNGDPDQSYGSIKYGLILGDAGVLYVYESGVSRGQWTYTTGDLLKVELSGGVVRYWRMAVGSAMWTLLYTSTVPPVYPLLVDTTIYTMGALLQSMQFGTGSCPAPPPPTATNTPTPVPPAGPCGPATWLNLVNVTANGSSLQKTAGGAAWNAGASSSTQLNGGDGAAQIRVDSATGYRMFGLSNSDPDQGYASLKYALIPGDAGVLFVYESGTSRGQFAYGVGDLLKVEVVGGVVRYYRQVVGSGVWTLLYTSTVAPTYPLLLDTSIYTVGAQLQNVQFGVGTCP